MCTNFCFPDPDIARVLKAIGNTLGLYKMGILALDATPELCRKRLKKVGLENTIENRKKFREIICTCSIDLCYYIAGVLLSEEAITQQIADGATLIRSFERRAILCGVTLETVLLPLYGTVQEYVTRAPDNLDEICARYKKSNCHFAKWRCVFSISENTPSIHALEENARLMAQFAYTCQMNKMLPILSPEILQDGDHDLKRSQMVTETVLRFVYKALLEQGVYLEGTILCINMVMPGTACQETYSINEIAEYTLNALQRTVPPAVPGIIFLSGGLPEEDATLQMNAFGRHINEYYEDKPHPWFTSFGYGYAITGCALKAWAGKKENIQVAQQLLLIRAMANSDATLGKYAPGSAEEIAIKKGLISEKPEN